MNKNQNTRYKTLSLQNQKQDTDESQRVRQEWEESFRETINFNLLSVQKQIKITCSTAK